MTEWWTYRPSDFLMFAPRTWWRLFELHNEALWPAQPLLMLAGLAWLVVVARALQRGDAAAAALRGGAAALAAAWAFVGWAFLLQRYAPINWPAAGFAALFALQSAALLALAAGPWLRLNGSAARCRAGLFVIGWALLGHPLLAPAFGRPWSQAEVFGLAPDPTVIATLGLLLCARVQGRAAAGLAGAVWAICLAWLAVSAATLATLGSAQAGVLILLAAFAAWSVVRSRG